MFGKLVTALGLIVVLTSVATPASAWYLYCQPDVAGACYEVNHANDRIDQVEDLVYTALGIAERTAEQVVECVENWTRVQIVGTQWACYRA